MINTLHTVYTYIKYVNMKPVMINQHIYTQQTLCPILLASIELSIYLY